LVAYQPVVNTRPLVAVQQQQQQLVLRQVDARLSRLCNNSSAIDVNPLVPDDLV
jgi:hypothetical protein